MELFVTVQYLHSHNYSLKSSFQALAKRRDTAVGLRRRMDGRSIDFLLFNPEIAKKMGENGRKLIEKKYNWEIEERKLLNLYSSL